MLKSRKACTAEAPAQKCRLFCLSVHRPLTLSLLGLLILIPPPAALPPVRNGVVNIVHGLVASWYLRHAKRPPDRPAQEPRMRLVHCQVKIFC
jgi:hypothetical protein